MRCPNFPLILAHLNRLLFGSQIRKNGLLILDLLAIAWIQRFFASKTLNLLGKASFAFYLIHISYVNIRLNWMFLASDRNFVLLWMISILMYLLLEKLIYNAIRMRLR